MQRLPSSRFVASLPLLTGLLLLSCRGVPLQQYHLEPGECVGDPATTCSDAYIEDHRPEYLLGFIELDDLGWAWDRNQGLALFAAIDREVKERDVLMVVFAHGWKHNASSCDNNVACFRDTLSQLHVGERAMAAAEEREERRIIGVYVGWRGLSVKGKIGNTTFYGRKGTAHKVGSGAVTELLVRLEYARRQAHQRDPDSLTRLVIVGHSFGGALIYSATSQLMMERLAAGDVFSGTVRGVGDLVMLVNPAFEAARYQPLHDTLTAKVRLQEYGPDQKPVMAIVTSRADGATLKAFPAGRAFSAKKDDYRPDRRAEQKASNKTAVGHYEPFRTHFLDVNDGTPEPTQRKDNAPGCSCPFKLSGREMTDEDRASEIQKTLKGLREQRRESKGALMSFPTADLRHDNHSPYLPIQMISVDPKIIQDHNDIYQPAFIDFLRNYILLAAGPEESGD